MPVLETSTYKAPLLLRNGHLQTMYPRKFRKLDRINYQRTRINTDDGDFLDLDWSKVNSDKLTIVCHGLEGSSESIYVNGMTRALNAEGFDVLAWNYRGCSGEPNRLLRWYHAGETNDLTRVFSHILFKKQYKEINLIGFSLGGNMVLKFLGQKSCSLNSLVNRAITFSVPCDLKGSVEQLAKKSNKRYLNDFMGSFQKKIAIKSRQFPGQIDALEMENIKNFIDFDEKYTAPLHGFKSAEEYWTRSSSLKYLEEITVPTLLVNAKNDPFLSSSCFPYEAARKNPYLFLETPRNGGHVGFVKMNSKGTFWSEERAVSFLREELEH